MREVINRQLVNSAIRHNASLRLTYMNNPKVGSSNLKAAMWAQADRNTGRQTLLDRSPHDRDNAPFVRHVFKTDQYDFARFTETPLFSVVRNPFTRILSAYLGKIARTRAMAAGRRMVWKNFCNRFGIDPTIGKEAFTFKDFLEVLASDRVENLDPHFRPQYINILYPFTPFEYVGKLERMQEVQEFMAANDIAPATFNRSPTGASEFVNAYYDKECEALVQEIYRDDFTTFAYYPGIRYVNHVEPVPVREPVANRLAEFIRSRGRSIPSVPSWELVIRDVRAT